jgi:hypothetical protein
MRKIAWIISIDLATKTVDWVPFPTTHNWWLRLFDGPEAAEAHALSYAPLTPAQNRSLKAVGDKLVIGPDQAIKVAEDPWIWVYDTNTKAWTSFSPPSSYSLTNGGHDWPNSVFSLVAMPSLGEVWLAGSLAANEVGSSFDLWKQSKGMHRREAYEATSKLYCGRRIVRFKVG